MELAIASLVLSAIGLMVSAYMTLAYYGLLPHHAGLIPATCPSDGTTCLAITRTPASRVFGVPNSVLGLFYYALVISAAATRIAYDQWWILQSLLGVTVLAVLFSLYLAWVLIFRMRTVCVLCFTTHAINLALLGLIAAAV